MALLDAGHVIRVKKFPHERIQVLVLRLLVGLLVPHDVQHHGERSPHVVRCLPTFTRRTPPALLVVERRQKVLHCFAASIGLKSIVCEYGKNKLMEKQLCIINMAHCN